MTNFSYLPASAYEITYGEERQRTSLGTATSAAGALIGAVGSFYDAQAKKAQYKASASMAQFESELSQRNARLAEEQAYAMILAGRQQASNLTLQYGQEQAAVRASTAARGVQLGSGSAAEIQASLEFAKRLDAITTNVNAVRAAASARIGAVNERNRSIMLGASAYNLRTSGRSINPALAGASSLLGSASRVADNYLVSRRN